LLAISKLKLKVCNWAGIDFLAESFATWVSAALGVLLAFKLFSLLFFCEFGLTLAL
jgi:hypothetical protein